MAEEYKVTQPAIINFKKFNDPKVVYDGNLTSPEDVMNFIYFESQPSMHQLDQEKAQKIFQSQSKTPGLILFLGQNEKGQVKADHKKSFKIVEEVA